jgi:DNA-binding transcriptional regulator YiaG
VDSGSEVKCLNRVSVYMDQRMTAQQIAALKENPLRLWRESSGLSQREAAVKIGVSRFLVSAWERNVIAPVERDHRAVCVVYGITLDELLEGVKWIWRTREAEKAAR